MDSLFVLPEQDMHYLSQDMHYISESVKDGKDIGKSDPNNLEIKIHNLTKEPKESKEPDFCNVNILLLLLKLKIL